MVDMEGGKDEGEVWRLSSSKVRGTGSKVSVEDEGKAEPGEFIFRRAKLMCHGRLEQRLSFKG